MPEAHPRRWHSASGLARRRAELLKIVESVQVSVHLDEERIVDWINRYRKFSTMTWEEATEEYRIEGYLKDVLDAVVATMEVR